MEASPVFETTSTTLEWKLSGLKKIFESSKGESKSKAIKSVRFGGGKWVILFYPNSGTDTGSHISLYLSCEPTTEEKEKAVGGKWVREGLFRFSFELRNVSKNVLFNSKEACDHSFSYKTANWGWAQFARRDTVYYQANSIKSLDAFIIICTITSSPVVPAPSPSLPVQSVPRALMNSIGGLLNNPLYSDVEFILSARAAKGTRNTNRKIWAMKRILMRADYFNALLNSGFAEAGLNAISSDSLVLGSSHDSMVESSSPARNDRSESQLVSFADDDASAPPTFASYDVEDSDFEEYESDNDDEEGEKETEEEEQLFTNDEEKDSQSDSGTEVPRKVVGDDDGEEYDTLINSEGEVDAEGDGYESQDPTAVGERNESRSQSVVSWETVLPVSNLPTSPKRESQTQTLSTSKPSPGPPKVRVLVKDVAYRTYLAMLHYLYTDTIVFAPLSSSFLHAAPKSSVEGSTTPQTSRSSLSSPAARNESSSATPQPKQRAEITNSPQNRKDWLREWREANQDRVEPCSAKAIYQLADKLDLLELKGRAFQHIVKSITPQNTPHEMFSSFSAKFEEVRKVQVDYFLAHWSEIRASDAMKAVWQQIRMGRHPGFEEVWPLIAMNLEFKPILNSEGSGDEKDNLNPEDFQ